MHDTDQKKILTEELEFYKRYYKEKEVSLQRGRIIMEKMKQQDEEKKNKQKEGDKKKKN